MNTENWLAQAEAKRDDLLYFIATFHPAGINKINAPLLGITAPTAESARRAIADSLAKETAGIDLINGCNLYYTTADFFTFDPRLILTTTGRVDT